MTFDPTLALTVLAQRQGRPAETTGAGLVGPPIPASLRTPNAGLWPAQGAQILAFTLIAAGAFMVVWVLWKRRMESRLPLEAPPPPEHDQPSIVGQVAETQRLFGLMNDADDLARRLAQRLDERSERLQHLIMAADERIARLERQGVQSAMSPTPAYMPAVPTPPTPAHPPLAPQSPAPASTTSASPAYPARPAPPSYHVPLRPATPTHGYPASVPQQPAAARYAPTPEIVSRPMRTPAPIGAATRAPAPQPAYASASASIDPLAAEIYRLSDEGMPVVDIARQLGQHTGKVELILALRQT